MVDTRDRRAELMKQTVMNGIDFVEILDDSETRLRVHFLGKLPDAATLAGSITEVTITGGASIPEVPVVDKAWGTDAAGLPYVDIAVAAPGDFSLYRLAFASDLLDRYFAATALSFKARCESKLDCEALPPVACEPPPRRAPAIDYRAKDFDSFKRALLEFSSAWYPAWQERSEADFGVMFLEALAAVADDLSYQQDRIAAEAWLETATERRSLTRLARLVDYEPRVATAASTFVRFVVAEGAMFDLPSGIGVSGRLADGDVVMFETGTGLRDTGSYRVDARWNALPAYWLDDSEDVLECGATSMYVRGRVTALRGQRIVIDSVASPVADRPIREIVTVTDTELYFDPLFNVQATKLVWEPPLRFDHVLRGDRTTVHGNLVPATHGERHVERFITSEDWSAPPLLHEPARAIVRTGPNDTPQFLFTLQAAPLTWLAGTDEVRPELLLVERVDDGDIEWTWTRWLLAANAYDGAFTIDPARYVPISPERGFAEYDGFAGETLRFGDGTFGPIPPDGATFEVTYRVGGGTRGNIDADTLDRIDPASPFAPMITGVANPLPATGGSDAESDDHIRTCAPQAFRARMYRAVRAEDYSRAATQELPWVQRAGTQFRWTGSWLSVFTTVDPHASTKLRPDELLALDRVLDRYRMAGYEAFGVPPRYASLDLSITVCARPDVYRSDVERAVVASLDGRVGFFAPDHFTFGMPLERSRLEAAVQAAFGVDGVIEVRYRRRGYTKDYVFMGDAVEVGGDEIIRVDNDPSRPDGGSLRVTVLGGR
jgi:hypothetical protein